MRTLGFITLGILSIALLLGASVGLGLFDLEYQRYFRPRQQEIERTVFEGTPSFVHGKAQHISRLRLDYQTAETDAHRAALREAILLEAAAIDIALLPPDIQTFINSIR